MKSSAVLTAEPAQAVVLDLRLTIDRFAYPPVIGLQRPLTDWTANGLRPRHNKQCFALSHLRVYRDTITMYSFVQRPQDAPVAMELVDLGSSFCHRRTIIDHGRRAKTDQVTAK